MTDEAASVGTLAPCPLCGGEAFETEDTQHDRSAYWTYGVSCCDEDTCGALVANFHRRAEAIAAWNRRAALQSPTPMDAERIELAEILDVPDGADIMNMPAPVTLRRAAELLRGAPADGVRRREPANQYPPGCQPQSASQGRRSDGRCHLQAMA